MDESPDKEAASGSLKKIFIAVVQWMKSLSRRILYSVRSESSGTSQTVLVEEVFKGKVATEQEKACWNKEFDRLNRSLEFHTDFGLKAVAFFYVSVGGVLSIFFGKGRGSSDVSFVLLGVPIILSWILGFYFFKGALIWDADAAYMRRLSARLGFEELTKIELLSELLRVFAVLFFITSAFLITLLIWVSDSG
jgi:hypothetical protein